MRAAIAQNMEKTLLYDEKKKAFDEGFKQGRETCGFSANEREDYERLRKENNRIFDVLYSLGMASIISTGEMGKKKVEAIKKALCIVENLDVYNLAFCVDSLKRKVGDLEKSMVELKALQEQATKGI